MCGLYGEPPGVNDVLELFQIDVDAEELASLEQQAGPQKDATAPGMRSIVVYDTGHDTGPQLMPAQFGFKPQWGKDIVINARADSLKDNPFNAPDYAGELGIWQMKYFREAIVKRRALLTVQHYFEGPKVQKLSKPYVVQRKDFNLFTLAAIYEEYIDNKGARVTGFAIITCPPNNLMAKIGHHRAPVVIPPANRDAWINPHTPRTELDAMMRPWDPTGFYAYPVSPLVHPDRAHKRPAGATQARYMQPVGPALFPDGDPDGDEADMIWNAARQGKEEQGNLF